MRLIRNFLVGGALSASVSTATDCRKTCVVEPSGTNRTDDAPAILKAFKECGKHGKVIFKEDTTYYVNSVLNITWLDDVEIDLHGELVVCKRNTQTSCCNIVLSKMRKS